MPEIFLNELILIIVAAFIGGFFARSLNLPPVLGYILSGIVFGTVGRNIFQSYDSLHVLSQVGVSLLLFTLGFEVSFDHLKKINKKIILVGFLQILISALFIFPVLALFGISFKIALLFSLLFSFSSTAVVVKILEEKGFLNDFPGNNVFIILLLQDIFVVPVIFLIPILFSNGVLSSDVVTGSLIAFAKSVVIFILIFLFSKFFLSKFLNILFRYPSQELSILATLFIAALSIGLFTSIGLPQSIAAFFAGVLISEEGKNLRPLSEIRPFRDLLLVLFFVLTGMLVDVSALGVNIVNIIFLSFAVILTKFIAIYIILRISGYLNSSASFISSYLSNIGEFAVIIGQIVFLQGVISGTDYNNLLAIFIFSLLFIPVFIRYGRSFVDRVVFFKLLKKYTGVNFASPTVLPIESLENHVVICGHGRVGKEVRGLLDVVLIPYVVIDFNRITINDLRNANKIAIYGDPTDEEVLRSAFVGSGKILVVAVPDSFSQKKIIKVALSINPKILVVCRSHIEEDRFDLLNLGVNSIVVPELEAGLRIGREVLEAFGISDEQTNPLIRKLRRQHILE